MLHYVASPEHTEKHMAVICDSLVDRPEIRPAPWSDLCYPVHKRDMASSSASAPLTLSPMTARFARGQKDAICHGKRWPYRHLLCFLWDQETCLTCVPPSLDCLCTLPHTNLSCSPYTSHRSISQGWWCNCSSPRPWAAECNQVPFRHK